MPKIATTFRENVSGVLVIGKIFINKALPLINIIVEKGVD